MKVFDCQDDLFFNSRFKSITQLWRSQSLYHLSIQNQFTHSTSQTVLSGLAPDGGLYIPSNIPSLPQDWKSKWASLSFTELALEIYSLYIPQSQINRSQLQDLINRSYASFSHPQIAPLRSINPSLSILELWHGPTFAFKDVALQFLGNLFEFFLARRNASSSTPKRITVIGATSGDTGSAAIYGLRGKKDVSIFILHPKGRVSPIQEAQMTTVLDPNVFNLAVKGTFDDCQVGWFCSFSHSLSTFTHLNRADRRWSFFRISSRLSLAMLASRKIINSGLSTPSTGLAS